MLEAHPGLWLDSSVLGSSGSGPACLQGCVQGAHPGSTASTQEGAVWLAPVSVNKGPTLETGSGGAEKLRERLLKEAGVGF